MGPSSRIPAVACLAMFLAAVSISAQDANPRSDGPAPKLDRYGDPLPKGAIDRLGSPRLRPPYVHGFRFSPDRRTLFTIGLYGDLIAWDAETGKKLRTLGKTKGLWLTISQDGKLLATWYPGTPVDIWDAVAGTKIRTGEGGFTGFAADDTLLPSGELRVRDLQFPPRAPAKIEPPPTPEGVSPKGRRAGTRSPDGAIIAYTDIGSASIHLWDVVKDERIGEIDPGKGGRNEHLFCTGFTPDSKTYISAWKSGIRIFSMTEKRVRALLPVPESHVFSIAPDGKQMAAAIEDGSILLFDIESAKEIRRWQAGCVRWGYIGYSKDGKTLASSAGSSIRFWNPETGERKDPYRDFDDEIKAIRFSPDGATIAVDGVRQLGIVDASSFRTIASIPRVYQYSCEFAPVYSPDSRTLAFVSRDRIDPSAIHVRSAEVATGKNRFHFTRSENNSILPFGLAFGRDGLRVWSEDEGQFVIFDGETGKEVSRFRWAAVRNFPDERSNPVVSRDGKLLACAESHFGNDRTLAFRDASSGAVFRQFEVPNELKPAENPKRLIQPPRTVLVGFSDTGRSFLAALTDAESNESPLEIGARDLFLWETSTGKLRGKWKGDPGNFSAYALSGNGRVLATAVGDAIKAIDPASNELLAQFKSHDSVIVALGLSPDGRKLVSGGADGTLTLWDLSSALTPSPGKMGEENLKKFWKALEGEDGQAASFAVGMLSRQPGESLPFLRPLLPHGPAADPKVVAKLVTDLDHDDFAVREKASTALAQMGYLAAPLLRAAAKTATAAETRGRLRALLTRLDNAANGRERNRMIRAIEILERIGSPEARAILRDMRDFGDQSIADEISDSAIAEPVNRLPNRP